MLERIFKNWKTTMLAAIIFIACIVLVWFQKASLVGVSGFLTSGALLFLKDKKIFENWRTTVLGVFIIAVGFVLIWYGKADLMGLYGFYAAGFGLFFAPDKKTAPVTTVILMMLLMSSCATYGKTTTVTEKVIRDTIRTVDTNYIAVKIPGETKYVTKEKIKYDTITIHKIKQGVFSIDTLRAECKYAAAEAGVTRNKPFLNLRQKNISIDTTIYTDRIKILEQKLRDKETTIVKKLPFFKNTWFWAFLVVVILLVFLIAILLSFNIKWP